MVAALRADLHNTAGKSFNRTFEKTDFIHGASSDGSLEARIHSLIAQGYAPAAAAAMASSTQTKEQRIHLIQSTMQAAEARKTKPRRKAG